MNHKTCLMGCGLILMTACGGGDGGDGPNQPPQIMGLGDLTVSANETSAPAAFTVNDDDGAGAVRLDATSDNDALLPDFRVELSGTGSNRTLTVSPQPGELGSAFVVVTATDRAGLQTSVSLRVDVVVQNVSFADFFRETFARDAGSAPRDLNSRSFQADAGADDFGDLLGGNP